MPSIYICLSVYFSFFLSASLSIFVSFSLSLFPGRVSAACNSVVACACRVCCRRRRRRPSHAGPTDPTDGFPILQIRVVNAFRQGLDTRYGEHSSTTLAEVLRKQTSLSKRLSQTSSIEYADNIPDELTIPEIDVERLSSHSHTETAV